MREPSLFQREVEADIHGVFLDLDFFGEPHRIAGRRISIVFDEDELKNRQGTDELNIEGSTVLFYAHTKDLPARVAPGNKLDIDGRIYIVDDWRDDMGMSTVVAHQNRTG